jgi:DNA primase
MPTHLAVHGVPISDVAAALGLEVVNRGARCFNKAAHKSNDAHPSLVFQPNVNRFKCYACGVRGDAIDLVRAVRQLGFREALRWLAQHFPGAVDSPVAVPPRSHVVASKTPDQRAMRVYVEIHRNCYELASCLRAAAYLGGRGIDFETANLTGAVQIGDPREVWDILNRRFSPEDLRAAGVVSEFGEFIFFRHRLVFTYIDEGQFVYLQARDIDGQSDRKELCLSGLCSPVPFNADLLRQDPDEVFICEGCIDTLSALQLGYPAVGVPGVTGFRPEWFSRFRGVRRVILAFDNDSAGHRHAAELRSQFRMRGITAAAICPRDVKDVNDLLVLHNGDLPHAIRK